MDDRNLSSIFGSGLLKEAGTDISAEEYRYFLDEIADGLYIADSSGTINYANRPLARILEKSGPEALIGRRLSEFTEPEFHEPLRAAYLKAAGSDGESFREAIRIFRSEGSGAWIEIKVRQAGKGFSGFSGIVRDITEQRATMEALQENEALYHSIMEMSPDAILMIQADGTISRANAQTLSLCGCGELSDFLGTSLYDLILTEEREHAHEDLGRVMSTGKLHNAEYRLLRKDGTVFWAEISASLIPESKGRASGILVTVRDISKRKSMEENLRNLSVTDELTGLYNRRGFSIAAEQELKHAHRTGNGAVLIFLDMDRLKIINDSFGHAEGDEALKAAAAALHTTFRESDILGRWGGDEFTVLALDVPEGSISVLQRRFEDTLARRNCAEGTPYPITFSSGTSRYDAESPLGLHEMILIADSDMYGSKLKK